MSASTLGIRALAEPVRSIAAASIAAGYNGIGAVLAFPSRILYISNQTDAALMFSFDGVNDHFAIAANAFLLLDWTANKSLQAQGLYLSEGTRIYVKEIAVPTTGSVYVSTFYGATF